ncbi:hypothetical protein Salat_0588900 [Sesamum alatum]|uniref:Uncharacterized protein n=1 Tax=Sesamum alatum TaxID=300844 RepID=A0AAE1YQ10_9LAMI|nr:hypothetical protein Salat_0588900 [Sesamum alatum]
MALPCNYTRPKGASQAVGPPAWSRPIAPPSLHLSNASGFDPGMRDGLRFCSLGNKDYYLDSALKFTVKLMNAKHLNLSLNITTFPNLKKLEFEAPRCHGHLLRFFLESADNLQLLTLRMAFYEDHQNRGSQAAVRDGGLRFRDA